MFITDRDSKIIQTLGLKVRVMSFNQIASLWWNNTVSGRILAKNRLKLLVQYNFLNCLYVNAHPMLKIKGPIFSWMPGDTEPDSKSLSNFLFKRLSKQPNMTTVYTLSRKSKNMIGSGAKPFNPLHATHDIHVSEVYLFLLKNDIESAEAWISEDMITKRGKGLVDPDAVLNYSSLRPKLFVEFCGKYDAKRIDHFHSDCQNNNQGYQLW